MAKVAINGLGRIGRATLKIVMDTPGLDMAAANDIGASDSLVYLLKYDTVYGRYEKTVEAIDDGHLTIGTHRLTLLRGESGAPAVEGVGRRHRVRMHRFTRRGDLDAQ